MKKTSKLNLAIAYIANIAFLLGVLCFAFPFFMRFSTDFMFIPLILTYCLLLLNAVISLKLSIAGKWAVTKSVVAFVCCFLTTPYLKWLAIFYVGSPVLLNFIVIVLHSITLVVVILPILGLVHKRRAKQAMKKEDVSGPDKSVQGPKRKALKPAIASTAMILMVVFLLVKIIPLVATSPIISVDYLTEYNKVTKPTGYDPNENAAPYYKKAFESLVNQSDYTQELWWDVWPADMNEAELNVLSNWLIANSEALGYLKRAAQKPYYWVEKYSEDNSLEKAIDFSALAKFRQSIDCLDLDTRLKASRGQIEVALENVIDIQKISGHLYNSKVLMEELMARAFTGHLCRTALTILDRKQVNTTILANFQDQLEQQLHQVPKGFVYDAEKLWNYDVIQRVFADDGSGDGRLIPGEYLDFYSIPELRLRFYLGAVWMSLSNPGKRQTTELTRKLYELLDELDQKTPWQLHQQGTSHEEQVWKLTQGNHYVWRVARYQGGLCIRRQEENTNIKALITSVALLRYKADKGQFPEDLDKLVSSGYLNELPMDLYSSGTLIYKLLGDNFTLYSLGADFDDDGGIQSKWGRNEEGGDRVFWPIKVKR